MAGGVLRLPLRPLRLPLLFPKKFFDTFWEPCFKPARVEGSLKIMLEKGKTTLLPFFHCEYTDGGEFFCRL